MGILNLRQAVAASIREMRDDAVSHPVDAEQILDRAGGYACALYIDLKNAGFPIVFGDDTLARCGGIPSDPQFFRDLGALEELLSQLSELLPSSP